MAIEKKIASEEYVNEKIAGIQTSSAIIDVVELPTENIQEECFYRVPSGSLVKNQAIQNMFTVHCVETLPETGLPAIDYSQNKGNVYYNVSDGETYGYVDDSLSANLEVPSGWQPAATLLSALDAEYAGVITNIQDDPSDSKVRLLLEYAVHDYKNGAWTSHKKVGWRGSGAFAEVFNYPTNKATGDYSHAEGIETHAEGDYSHTEGNSSHAEGDYSHAEGYASHAGGDYSHAEGSNSNADGYYSHAEGWYSRTWGSCSHAEGHYSNAWGPKSHAEGSSSHAKGGSSHAEGSDSLAEGESSHTEGVASHAEGVASHAEGFGYRVGIKLTGDANATVYTIDTVSDLIVGSTIRYTTYQDNYSSYNTAKITSIDADNLTITVDRTLSDTALDSVEVIVYVAGMALGKYSHSEGNATIAAGRSQHAQGEYNVVDPEYDVNNNGERGKYAHVVGNGTSHTDRSNAHTLDWEGNAWYQGRPQFGGNAQDDGSQTVMANGDREIFLTSPNGTKFRITVDDNGALSATQA